MPSAPAISEGMDHHPEQRDGRIDDAGQPSGNVQSSAHVEILAAGDEEASALKRESG